MNAQDWFNCVQVLDSEGEAHESWVTAIRLVYPLIESELTPPQSLFDRTWLESYSIKASVNDQNDTWFEIFRLLLKLVLRNLRSGKLPKKP